MTQILPRFATPTSPFRWAFRSNRKEYVPKSRFLCPTETCHASHWFLVSGSLSCAHGHRWSGEGRPPSSTSPSRRPAAKGARNKKQTQETGTYYGMGGLPYTSVYAINSPASSAWKLKMSSRSSSASTELDVRRRRDQGYDRERVAIHKTEQRYASLLVRDKEFSLATLSAPRSISRTRASSRRRARIGRR